MLALMDEFQLDNFMYNTTHLLTASYPKEKVIRCSLYYLLMIIIARHSFLILDVHTLYKCTRLWCDKFSILLLYAAVILRYEKVFKNIKMMLSKWRVFKLKLLFLIQFLFCLLYIMTSTLTCLKYSFHIFHANLQFYAKRIHPCIKSSMLSIIELFLFATIYIDIVVGVCYLFARSRLFFNAIIINVAAVTQKTTRDVCNALESS